MDRIKKETGQEIKATPEVREDLLWVWKVFVDLSQTRRTFFTGRTSLKEPISYTEICSYCQLHKICDERSLRLIRRIIPKLDEVYSQRQFEEAEKALKKSGD